MKRTLYLIPALLVFMLYGMLALLAGSFASFQLKAWIVLAMPVLSAVLWIKGIRWGFLPSLLLGAGLLGLGLFSGQQLSADGILGAVLLVYYLILGFLSLKKR